jgi:hypothetical protein
MKRSNRFQLTVYFLFVFGKLNLIQCGSRKLSHLPTVFAGATILRITPAGSDSRGSERS